jgi:hypothetical protein
MKTDKIIVKMDFGSHLYGTNTEDSDRDIKGIYLPSLDNCKLGRIKNSIVSNTNKTNLKNSKDDIDCEYYALQYFLLQLGVNGDTTFLDMIHAPAEALLETSDAWEELRESRSKFYTKSLKSYIGYCRSQAAKYGIRGSKLEEAQKILDVLNKYPEGTKLAHLWEELPSSEYVKRYNIDKCQSQDSRAFDFCGKKLMADTNVFFAKQTVQKFYDSYGARAKLAQANEGIDWKAISHAFRVGYQLEELYTTGDLKFPLKHREYLINLKKGNYHYLNDNIATGLEELVSRVDQLAASSNYPAKVDETFCINFILKVYDNAK